MTFEYSADILRIRLPSLAARWRQAFFVAQRKYLVLFLLNMFGSSFLLLVISPHARPDEHCTEHSWGRSLASSLRAAFFLQCSVLCTLAAQTLGPIASTPRRPMGSAWVLFPVLHLGNYLETISCSNHRTLLICFLSLRMIVLPRLNFSILKTFALYSLFFFRLFQAGSPCYSHLARSRSPCHHNSLYPLLMK